MADKIELAVVPVAGLGTRMLPLTRSIPKEMLPVGQRLCIEHIVEELDACGIREIVFVISEGKEKILAHFQPDPVLERRLRRVQQDRWADRLQQTCWSNRIRFQAVMQDEQKGLGHAIWCAREAVGERPFVVALGDSIICTDSGPGLLSRMCERFSAASLEMAIGFQQVPLADVTKYGIACPALQAGEPGMEFDLRDLVEKPSPDLAPSRLAVAARYVLSPTIFAQLGATAAGRGGEIQLTDAISARLQQGALAKGVCLSDGERRIDIGSIGGYLAAFIELALVDPEFGEGLRAQLTEMLKRTGPLT